LEIRHWGEPGEKQRMFLLCRAKYIAYGGARGGGKSWALRHKAALMCLRYGGFRALLLRRTYPELRENHILPLLSRLRGVAKYSETQKAFSFPNGSRLMFGYCDREADVLQYQGQEYDSIFMDEATHFSEYQFSVLTASLRGVNDFPKRFYLSCNPGGVGHAWVKRLFIEGDYRGGEVPGEYAFIPAKVHDNAALVESDPGYVARLQALPAKLRAAWLEGDWDALAGRFFPEFSRETHVVAPFSIPGGWAKYFAMDYGLDMLAGLWAAVDPAGRAVVYRELSESGLIISEAAKRIKVLTAEDVGLFIAPPDLWSRRQETGRSAAEIFAENGLYLTGSNNARIHGWMDLKEWLKPVSSYDGAAAPGITVFSTCRELIRSLTNILHSDKDPMDAAIQPHELTHHADALRYFVSARPLPAPPSPDADEYETDLSAQIAGFMQYGR